MITNYAWIGELLEELDNGLDEKATIYMIGGAVLLYQGLKPGTKDIDLIVGSKKEFHAFQKALMKKGFKPQIPGKEYSRMNLNQIYQKEDQRIDLFEKEVCGRFSLSEGIKERAKELHELENLIVKHCANEDIFLFKTMTEREGDLDDCLSLARTELHWEEMLRELKSQIQKSKQDVWVTWIGERMDMLREKGVIIPIMPEIDKLRNKFFDKLEKKQSR
ncbi:MAG: DUF6036 family nucleotidyltransferase [Nanobdellota archaeon]